MVFVLQYSLYRSVCLWRLHKNTLVPEIPGWLLATGHNSEKLLIKSRAEKKNHTIIPVVSMLSSQNPKSKVDRRNPEKELINSYEQRRAYI